MVNFASSFVKICSKNEEKSQKLIDENKFFFNIYLHILTYTISHGLLHKYSVCATEVFA